MGDILCFQPVIAQQPIPFQEVQEKPGFSLCCPIPTPTIQAASSSSKQPFAMNIPTNPLNKQEPVPLKDRTLFPDTWDPLLHGMIEKTTQVFLSETGQNQWKGWIISQIFQLHSHLKNRCYWPAWTSMDPLASTTKNLTAWPWFPSQLGNTVSTTSLVQHQYSTPRCRTLKSLLRVISSPGNNDRLPRRLRFVISTNAPYPQENLTSVKFCSSAQRADSAGNLSGGYTII